jgi:hypothetical protein
MMSLTMDRTDQVVGELNYLRPMAVKPYTLAYDPAPGEVRTNIENEPHQVAIANLREMAVPPTLDREGFALIRAPSAVSGFADEAEVERVYHPESARLIQEATGADRVVIFDHTIRRRMEGVADRAPGTPRQPVARVHVDHTEGSGPQRVRDLMGDEAEALLRGRVEIVNLWRPIRGPLEDAPLAMCDARTIAPEELVASDLIYRDRRGETYSVIFSPRHRWFYAPRMEADEALLLKVYDSARDGRARFSPHTAFIDPTAPADKLPRESIEVRALMFHAT